MAFVANPIPQAELDALAAGKTVFLTKNALRDFATEPKWSTVRDWAGPDITDLARPPRWVHNGMMNSRTGPLPTSSAEVHLLFDLNERVDIDSIVIAGHNFAEPVWRQRIELWISNAPNFDTAIGISAWDLDTTVSPSKRRLVSLDTNGRLSGVKYAALSFQRTDGGNYLVSQPAMAEVFAGRRRQLSRKPDYPGDERAETSYAYDFVADDGTRSRMMGAHRQRDLDLEWTSDATDMLNDLQTWRDHWKDTNGCTQSFWYIADPGSAPQGCALMQVPAPNLNIEYLGPNHGIRKLAMVELPQFVSQEED